MSIGNIAQQLHGMVAAPAGGSSRYIQHKSEDGITKCYGTMVPVDGGGGFAPGCVFQHVDGAAGGMLYVNEGTATSCDFNAVSTASNLNAQVDVAFPPYGSASSRGPSAAIWGNCPVLDYKLNPTLGWEWFDDMIQNAPLAAAGSAGVALGGGWWGHTSATAGSTITPQLDHSNGEVHLLTTTTDEVSILSNLCGHNTAGYVKFLTGKKTWFEARVAVTNVTDAKSATFIGFAEEGLLADATLLNADQAVVDKDFVGFCQLQGDGDAWQTRFNTAAGAGVNGTAVSATADVIVTTVMAKLGIHCDGTTVYFFADGVLLADSVALATANFPDGEELALYLGTGSVDGGDIVCGIDWVRVAQEI